MGGGGGGGGVVIFFFGGGGGLGFRGFGVEGLGSWGVSMFMCVQEVRTFQASQNRITWNGVISRDVFHNLSYDDWPFVHPKY